MGAEMALEVLGLVEGAARALAVQEVVRVAVAMVAVAMVVAAKEARV